ncbi:MAG: ATP-binding protein [bacterium]|nr:ATP-binding protein [bacterium]
MRQRVAELEHALEVHVWGGVLFQESALPQLIVDYETGAILNANAAARRFYGEALLQQLMSDCLCAEGLEWKRDLKPLLDQQPYGVRVSRQHTYNNDIRTVEAHYARMHLHGRPVVHMVIVDITDKECARQELESTKARYEAFIQLSNEGIWRNALTEPIPVQLPLERQIALIFERSYLAECNPVYCRMWGAQYPKELIGHFMRERVSPEDPKNIEMVRQFIMNGYSLSGWLFEVPKADGDCLYLLCSLQGIVHEGLLCGTWGVCRDLSELLRTQRALQQSEERYRTFIEYANEGIWRFDMREPIPVSLPIDQQVDLLFQHAYLAECNDAFARMYGVASAQALINIALRELLIPTEPQNREMLRAFVQNNYRVEGVVSKERAADGSERYFLNSFFGIVEDGALMRAWGVQTDITEMRRLQEQLDQAYRLESIGRLAGGIAHDFNNVLTAVLGFAELARGRVQDETTLRYLDGITQAAERAANLNRQLLAYARRQIIQLTPIDLSTWLEGTLDILRRVLPENIRLETQVQRPLGTVQADPNLLLQIVLNLLVNARDAMPDGGTITIALQNKTVRRLRTNHVPNGHYVTLTVIDRGTGISSEVLPHIFEPFFTTKPFGQGTGMGLAAVQGAVQQLGGAIEVRTRVGEGTRFIVYLPRILASKRARLDTHTQPT